VALPGLELRVLGRPARRQSLYRLRYLVQLLKGEIFFFFFFKEISENLMRLGFWGLVWQTCMGWQL
jgi:hypothetical protein